jgi:hypothetical protein
MRIGVFLAGFVTVMFFAMNYLASAKPASETAGMAFIALGFFAILAGVGAFSLSTARLPRPPTKLMAFCTGAASAAGFFIAIGLVDTGPGFVAAMGLALMLAWVLPHLSRAGS